MIRRMVLVGILCFIAAAFSPTRTESAFATITYPPGRNLVAGPNGAHLSGVVGPMYTLKPGAANYDSVPATDPLEQCTAYWAWFPSGGTLTLPAIAFGNTNCGVKLPSAGWLMVGNPVLDTSNIVGAQVAYTYPASSAANGAGYKSATTIPGGQGAFVCGSDVLAVVQ